MTPELARRIAFTLGALLVYRLGSYIPIFGLDPQTISLFFRQHHDGLSGFANVITGGALKRISIFALGIFPYLSAAIILQLVALVVPRFHAISRRGEQGRSVMSRYTIGLAAALAAIQALGLALALESSVGIVPEPGPFFLLSATLTLTGGTVLLIWLAEQMTLRGIGNGLALLLCVGIVAEFISTVVSTVELNSVGLLSGDVMIALTGLTIAVVALIAFMERARRLVPLEFIDSSEASDPRRHRGHLALKLNGAGLLPAIIAGWLVYIPIVIVGIIPHAEQGWFAAMLRHLQPGRIAHMLFIAVAVTITTLIYTAFVIDPEHAADSLQARGGAIPGIAPGEATADHLDRVVTSTTLIGAAYLVLVLLLPEALIAYAKVPYYFAGASVLVVVCAVLDIEAQVRSYSRAGRGTTIHETDSSRTAGGG